MEKIEIVIRYTPDIYGKDWDQTLSLVHTISMIEYRTTKDPEMLLEALARTAVNKFVYELELELENRRYDPKRVKPMPLTLANTQYDPSLAPDFYKDSNA